MICDVRVNYVTICKHEPFTQYLEMVLNRLLRGAIALGYKGIGQIVVLWEVVPASPLAMLLITITGSCVVGTCNCVKESES